MCTCVCTLKREGMIPENKSNEFLMKVKKENNLNI